MAAGMTRYSDYLNQNPDAVDAMTRPPAPVAVATAAPNDLYARMDEMVKPQPPAQQPVQTAVQAQPAPEPEIPTVAPVVAPKTRSAKAALAQLTAQDLTGQNEVTASIGRDGEAKIDASKKAAAVKGEAAGKSRRYVDAAEHEVDDNRVMSNEAQTWLHDDMIKLREPPLEKTAWQKTTSALTGVLGGIMQGWLGQGIGGGLALGMQAIDDHVNRNVREQLEEHERAGDNIGHTTKYLDTLGKDSANELDTASKLVANHYLATSHELEKLAEEAKVPELREGYLRLALGSQEKAREGLKGGYRQQVADERAAAAARARALAAGPQWDNMDPTLLEQLEAQGKLPLAGLNALNESRKKAREAKGDQDAVGGEIFPGYVSSQPLLASSDAKARTIYSAGASIKSDLARLAEMRRKNGGGTWNRDDVKEAKGIIATLPSRYSQMFGSGAPNNTELELFGSYLTDPTDYQFTGLDPEESYRRLAAQVDRTAEAQLGGFGIKRLPNAGITFTPEGKSLAPGRAAAPPQAPAQPAAPVTYNMIDKTGRLRVVPAARVQAAKNSGLYIDPEIDPTIKRQAAPAPAPAPDPYAPQDYDTDENQRVLAALGSG